jgi:hypothetical protein
MVRAEDLIFFPEQVTRQVCKCAGGTLREPFSVAQLDLKKNKNPGSRAMAKLMIRYGSGQKTQQMTEDDLEYAKTHINSGLMKMNGYQHPQDESGIPVQRELKKKVVKSEPLIRLLNLAGKNVNTSTLKRLPTWSENASAIGSTKPIISGLDQCSSLSRKNTSHPGSQWHEPLGSQQDVPALAQELQHGPTPRSIHWAKAKRAQPENQASLSSDHSRPLYLDAIN